MTSRDGGDLGPVGAMGAYCSRRGLLSIVCRLCAADDGTSDRLPPLAPPGPLPDFGQQISTRTAPPPDPRLIDGSYGFEMACCSGDDDRRRSQRRRAGLIGAACWLLMAVSLVGLGAVFGAVWGVTR
jgi:hypothetical protein